MKVTVELDDGKKIEDVDTNKSLGDIEEELNTGEEFILIGETIYRTCDIQGVFKQK